MMRRPSRRRVLHTLSLGIGSAVAGCTSESRTTTETPEKPERSENAPPLKWIAAVHRYPWRSPTHYNRTIYCGGDFRVSAMDAADGTERWNYEIDTPNDHTCYNGTLGVADGTIYTVGCDKVYAIDENGESRWAVDYDSDQHGSTVPAISETGLFFGGNSLVQRDRKSGNVIWSADLEGTSSSPTLGDEYVFVGTSRGILQAISKTSGESHVTMETEMSRASVPVEDGDGRVFFGTVSSRGEEDQTGYLYAVDVAEKRWLWRIETGPLPHTQAPVIQDDTLFVSTETGTLYGIEPTDGTIRWSFDAGTEELTAPQVGDDLVYVAGGDTIHAVDIDTGNQHWSIKWDERTVVRLGSPLLVTDEELCIGTHEPRGFYAFDLS